MQQALRLWTRGANPSARSRDRPPPPCAQAAHSAELDDAFLDDLLLDREHPDGVAQEQWEKQLDALRDEQEQVRKQLAESRRAAQQAEQALLDQIKAHKGRLLEAVPPTRKKVVRTALATDIADSAQQAERAAAQLDEQGMQLDSEGAEDAPMQGSTEQEEKPPKKQRQSRFEQAVQKACVVAAARATAATQCS